MQKLYSDYTVYQNGYVQRWVNMSEQEISVVIPTHNRGQRLIAAIDSALNNDKKLIKEIIVVDDNSTDNTQDLIKRKYQNNKLIKYYKNEVSCGGAESRNIGVSHASGEWIAFLDDDDFWLNNKLEVQLSKAKKNPNTVAVSCAYIFKYPFGIKKKITLNENYSRDDLLCNNILGGASLCLVKKSTFCEIGGFDKRLRSGQDWDLWLRLDQVGIISIVNKPLVIYDSYLGIRITRNNEARYLGRKLIYEKYKNELTEKSKKAQLSALYYSEARLNSLKRRERIQKLKSAVKYSDTIKGKFLFILSALPRILINQ